MASTDATVDFERPARLSNRQAAALAAHVAEEVWPWSRGDRARLDRAGLGRTGLRGIEDLQRLDPVRLEDLGDGSAVTLRPEPDRVGSLAPWRLRARWWWADLVGRRARLVAEELDPRFKPVVWLRQGPLRVGLTTADLDRLGDLGRRWLAAAGVRADDRVVLVGGLADGLAGWQVSLGCRAGGVAATVLDRPAGPPGSTSAAEVADLAPTTLAGGATDLLALGADGLELDRLGTVLVTDGLPTAEQRRALRAIGTDPRAVAVCGAWAPPGVRALWGECRGGHLHTWPDTEVIEIVDPLTGKRAPDGEDGEIVWTPVGWRGTAPLRLATGAFGRLEARPCPACRRTTPRLVPVELDPPFAAVLDAHPDVVDWFAEVAPGRLHVEVAVRRGTRAATLAALGEELGATVERSNRTQVRRRHDASGGRIERGAR